MIGIFEKLFNWVNSITVVKTHFFSFTKHCIDTVMSSAVTIPENAGKAYTTCIKYMFMLHKKTLARPLMALNPDH